jgi:hypothetical protein
MAFYSLENKTVWRAIKVFYFLFAAILVYGNIDNFAQAIWNPDDYWNPSVISGYRAKSALLLIAIAIISYFVIRRIVGYIIFGSGYNTPGLTHNIRKHILGLEQKDMRTAIIIGVVITIILIALLLVVSLITRSPNG